MATRSKGLGTVLQAKISGSFTTIGQRTSIEGPDNTVGIKEITHLDSPAVERGATIPDGGDVTLKIWWDPNDSTHQTLASWGMAPPAVTPSWKILFPTSPARTASFDAVLSGFKPGGMTPDGYLEADIKLSVSGLVVWS